MTRLIRLTFCVTIAACGSNRATSAAETPNGNSADCPADRPEDGTKCNGASTCDYFIRGSLCMPGVPDYDIYGHCDCVDGRWSCREDWEDCFPLDSLDAGSDNNPPDAGPDKDSDTSKTCPSDSPEEGSPCDAHDEGLYCDYFIRGSYCMPGVPDYDIYNHCRCKDGTWKCHPDWEDCPPASDAGTDGQS